MRRYLPLLVYTMLCLWSSWYFRLFEIAGGATTGITILEKELPPLQNAGLQKCMAFSFDGSKLAVGGVVRRNQYCFIRAFLNFGCIFTYCKLFSGWMSENYGLAKPKCNLGGAKSTQIHSGYGFQVITGIFFSPFILVFIFF